MRLACLALVHTLRKGYHQHDAVNAIIQELSDHQTKHSFTLRPMWVRRCWNETADALSKNDMDALSKAIEASSSWSRTILHHHSSAVCKPNAVYTALAQRSKHAASMTTWLVASTDWWHKAASVNGEAKRSSASH